MKIYTVLYNSYDYYRFTDYIGTYNSISKAKLAATGTTYFVEEGEGIWNEECEGSEKEHYIVVTTDFEGEDI